jgi:hypothetical protein
VPHASLTVASRVRTSLVLVVSSTGRHDTHVRRRLFFHVSSSGVASLALNSYISKQTLRMACSEYLMKSTA